MEGTVSGSSSSVENAARPGTRARTRPMAAGMPTSRLRATEAAASSRLVASAPPNCGMMARYQASV